MYGVIYHGGSGTTHLALKCGCATLIIPHIIDQFVWDGIVSDLGAGPKRIKIGDLSVNPLEPKILDLVKNPAYKKKAEQVASQMAQEDLREEFIKPSLRDNHNTWYRYPSCDFREMKVY